MFAPVFKSTVILSAVAFLAITRGAATPTSNGECNVSNMKCCNTMTSSASSPLELLGLLEEAGLGGLLSGLNIGELIGVATSVVGDIGLSCTDIIGLADAANCQQEAVCCANVTYNGLINIGCSPINV